MENAVNVSTQKVIKVIKKVNNNLSAQTIREQLIDTRLPVAAYGRVSTNSEEQEDSFIHQKQYYTEYIQSKPEWRFVGIYADPGITGTRADKRPEFQRMITDCHAGKIKKILCKSISRFARNTIDALKYIRELKEIGVGIYFETQNIDTLTAGGDILITILAAIAEQESRNMSENIKWAYQKKYEKGEYHIATKHFLGYDRDENNNIVINQEQASIVRRIYREFLNGSSCSSIAKRLMDDEIPTPSGKKQWRAKVIESILRNEKYYGSAYLGKTHKVDVLSKIRQESDEFYYVENGHPAIIPKDTWELVQLEFERRGEMRTSTPTSNSRYSSKYPFSKRLICGECGIAYRRHAQYKKGEYLRTWVCVTHKEMGNDHCKQRYLLETEIEQAFIKVLMEVVDDMDGIRSVLKDNVLSSLDDNVNDEIENITIEMDKLRGEMIELNRRKRAGTEDYDAYIKRANEIADEIERLEKQQTEWQNKLEVRMDATRRIKDIMEVINGITPTTEFDGEMFKSLVENVVIKDRELTFNFNVGISRKIAI